MAEKDKKKPKFKTGDRFLVRIDRVYRGRNDCGEFTDYLVNAEPPKGGKGIQPEDGCVVTEKFLEQCSPFDIITDHEKVDTGRLELKPCPFCGCRMWLVKSMMCNGRTVRYEPVGRHRRGCQLMCAAGMFVGNPTTIEGAVKKWNRRSKKAEKAEK